MKKKKIIELLTIGITLIFTMVISLGSFILTQSNHRIISFIPEEFELILLGILAIISLFVTAGLLILLNERIIAIRKKRP